MINIEDLTLKQIREIQQMTCALDKVEKAPESTGKQLIGEKVIIRCRDAGVHFGELVNYEGREVTLKNSRRMWYWKASKGHTLSGCAIHGVTSDCKIAGEVKTIVLPEACEIISCTDEAAKSISDADEYRN